MKNDLTKFYFNNRNMEGFSVYYACGVVFKLYKNKSIKSYKYTTLNRLERFFIINYTNKNFYNRLTKSGIHTNTRKEHRNMLRKKYLVDAK